MSFEIISTLHVLIDFLISWWKAPDLAKWLNHWNIIETEIKEWIGFDIANILPARHTTYKFQCYLAIFYVIMPALIFGTLLVSWEFNISYPIYCVMLIVHAYASMVCYCAEDAKAIIMFKCLVEGFGKVCYLFLHYRK